MTLGLSCSVPYVLGPEFDWVYPDAPHAWIASDLGCCPAASPPDLPISRRRQHMRRQRPPDCPKCQATPQLPGNASVVMALGPWALGLYSREPLTHEPLGPWLANEAHGPMRP